MSIIKKDIRDKLDRLTLFKPSMATSKDPKSEDMYANTSSNTNTQDIHDKFEERFNFRRSSDLPPPIPPHTSKDTITLPRTGTKPKLGSPRSPRLGVKEYHWESKDTSFDTIESSYKEDTRYKEQLLLHDTLKTLAVKETTERAATITINRFICLTIIITNLMSIGFSVLGTILVMNSLSPNNPTFHLDHQPRFTDQRKIESLTNPNYQPLTLSERSYHPVDQIPPVDLLPVDLLPVDYPVHTLKSDGDADTDADAHTDVAADAADTYKIHIKVSPPKNQPMDQPNEDFWLN